MDDGGLHASAGGGDGVVVDDGYEIVPIEYREDVQEEGDTMAAAAHFAGAAVSYVSASQCAATPVASPSRLLARSVRAGHQWDTFYRQSGDRFFKDRHYLLREFPELAVKLPWGGVVLDVGCGVGNAAIPLLEAFNGAATATTTSSAVCRDPGPAGAVPLAASTLATATAAAAPAAAGPVASRGRLRIAAFDMSRTAARILQQHAYAQGPDPLLVAFPYDAVGGCRAASSVTPACRAATEDAAPPNATYAAAVAACRAAGATSMLTRITNCSAGGCGTGSDNDCIVADAAVPPPLSTSAAPPALRMSAGNPAAQGFDAALCYFVMSALPSRLHLPLLQQIACALRPGGLLVFRDYAIGDAAEGRFAAEAQLEEHVFVRGDGTLAAFLSPPRLIWLAACAGLEVTWCKLVLKTIANRATGQAFKRRWLQALLRKPDLLR